MATDLDGAKNASGRRGVGGRKRRPGVTDAILEATIVLAAEGGIEELTLEAIAGKAGVGRPTIYRRWPTKDDLMEAAIDRMIQQMVVVPKPGNIRNQLIERVNAQIERLQSPLRSLWLAYFNAEEAHVAKEALKRGRDLEADIIRRAVERGELRADTDPELLIELLFAMVWYQTSAHRRHLEPSFAEAVVDAVLNSWIAEPPPVKPEDHADSVASGP
jgi:AcrR family transcriptional regulator